MLGRVSHSLASCSSSLVLAAGAGVSCSANVVGNGALSVISSSSSAWFSSSALPQQSGHKAPATSLKGVKAAAAAAGRASLAPKPVYGFVDESGMDSEDVKLADAADSIDGKGTGVKTGIAALLERQQKSGSKKAISPATLMEAAEGVDINSVTSLTANPYRYPALKPKAAPMWMLFEAQREERPLPDLGKGAGKRLRDNPTEIQVPLLDIKGRAYATGRRKEAVARVWVGPGDGRVTINGLDLADALPRIADRQHAIEPLVVTQTCGALDVMLTVKGGGLTGQAGAIRHGLANALANYDPYLKPALRRFKLIQRDPRMVERKKPGRKKARKQFQWVKR